MNSCRFEDLYSSDADEDGFLYVKYLSMNPSQKKYLSDSLSRYSDIPVIPDKYKRLHLVPLLSDLTNIKETIKLEVPFELKLSSKMLHQTTNNPELKSWVAGKIRAAVKEYRDMNRQEEIFLRTSCYNMVRYYAMFLRGDFVDQVGKLIIVTRNKVFATEYNATDEGERQASMEIGLVFHDLHPAVVPAQGFWTSIWLSFRNQTTPEYPETDNSISVMVGNQNPSRRFNVSSLPHVTALTPRQMSILSSTESNTQFNK